MHVHVAPRGTQRWQEAIELVRRKYQRQFGANVSPDPDAFIVCTGPGRSEGGAPKVVACAGMVFGSGARFFSEKYLDEPIEQAISRIQRCPVSRDAIVEAGALASVEHGAGTELIRVLPILTWCLGKRYILCTAVRSVRCIFEAAGIPFQPVRAAEAERLDPADRERWGNYYASDPQTGYVRLDAIANVFAVNTGRYHFAAVDVQVRGGEEQYGETG